MSALVFVHGGGDGAYRYDQRIVERLQALLGPDRPLDFPFIRGLEALEFPAIASELGAVLRALPPGAIVIGHSLGGSAVLKLLVEGLDPKLSHLFLLATPYEGADGEWGDSAFGIAADFAKRLPRGLPITIYHSDDDDMIPAASAEQYRQKLPGATVIVLHGYGHQFTGPLDFLSDAIRGAAM